jgi:hypothetical protein
MTPVLLPLYAHPAVEPAAWRAAAAGGGDLTVVAAGPHDHELADAVSRLAKAGVATLGRVDAAFATRPVADLLDEVEAWASCPVAGVFLDQAPTSPFCLGPVALAVRVARRAGLFTVVLNPGVPTDPLYRELGVPICTFEGAWGEYRRWSARGAVPGDGHLVHSVPVGAMPAARALLAERGAGWGLVTDRTPPTPYAGLPSWLSGGGGAGSAGTRTRSGW